MNKHIVKYNTKCDNWTNVEGFNDAKCICQACRTNRALKPKEKLTGADFIEAARLRFLAKRNNSN